MKKKVCQLVDVPNISERLGVVRFSLQRIRKLRHSIKKRINYLVSVCFTLMAHEHGRQNDLSEVFKMVNFQPGDLVRVRSKREIKATLDGWNHLGGCGFMEEMWDYCGSTHRVMKRVERFLDERDYLVKKCRGLVILEGVTCGGTKDFGPCDRTCFFFWREEWLEKV